MQLCTKIFIGLLAGIVVGLIANLAGHIWLQNGLVALRSVGTAFIRLITMLVVPLVVASLLVGTPSLGDIGKLGRIGGKTIASYLITTAIAVVIGLILSDIVRPGSRIDPATRDSLAAQFAGEAAVCVALAEAPVEQPETPAGRG
ncbi:MAG TPA: cation:dicarboxylase symporter family transporter [Longimicrobiales bacterium]